MTYIEDERAEPISRQQAYKAFDERALHICLEGYYKIHTQLFEENLSENPYNHTIVHTLPVSCNKPEETHPEYLRLP